MYSDATLEASLRSADRIGYSGYSESAPHLTVAMKVATYHHHYMSPLATSEPPSGTPSYI
ncbi:hypothetical protein PCANC_23308 [Puccinia coronata f. sp. avenae]|uniref:Uncharacterized protein n=1 Tax=Puccinia coronata f. sp. avenae TaxID=200324 RepID=A0A2N5VHN6_9BASI|nr:hypothetical protein PCASD_22908 [Puccinia coronata f. sp. avenae]PLW28969.1 hypothetical protein PCANC_23308 [Puccinia coronata f. sp. avenae]PLW49426.1 hypothetical protein PCASD_01955 [Puccinia coronata f. sp. avenae]